MAHETNKQQPQSAAEDALFYDKSNMPADLAPPVRALLRRGWRCEADNPRLENGLWFPPGAADANAVTEANLFGNVMRPSNDPKEVDADGNPLSVPHWEQLRMQSGRDQTGADTLPIRQTIIRPRTRGLSFHEAVETERNRGRETKKTDDRERLKPVPATA